MLPNSFSRNLAVELIVERLNKRSSEESRKIAAALSQWLELEAVKKAVPNREILVANFSALLVPMCEALVFKQYGDAISVEVNGPCESTFVSLSRGTDWFIGHPDLANRIISILK